MLTQTRSLTVQALNTNEQLIEGESPIQTNLTRGLKPNLKVSNRRRNVYE